MIKPEFFDDPQIADLSPRARLFFIGLWMQADRAGRLVDDVRRLKARIFPYDDVDTEALAVELHGKDLIRRYSDADGHGYIWIRSFAKHQRPHPKEPPSVIPPWTSGAVERNGGPCKNTEGTSESGSLVNGTRNPIHGTQKLEVGIPQRQIAAPAFGGDDARFDRFWAVYPNKKGKDDARKAWRKRRPSEALTDLIIAAVEAQRSWPEWLKENGQFIPHPATWLNRGSWEDESQRAGGAAMSETARHNIAASDEAGRLIEANEVRRGYSR
jgi:hypothetical protein